MTSPSCGLTQSLTLQSISSLTAASDKQLPKQRHSAVAGCLGEEATAGGSLEAEAVLATVIEAAAGGGLEAKAAAAVLSVLEAAVLAGVIAAAGGCLLPGLEEAGGGLEEALLVGEEGSPGCVSVDMEGQGEGGYPKENSGT